MQSPVLLMSHYSEDRRKLNNEFINQIKKIHEMNNNKEDELKIPASLSQGTYGFAREMVNHWSKSISDFENVIDYSIDYCDKESLNINKMTPKLRISNNSFNIFYIKKYKFNKRKKNRFLLSIYNKRKKDIIKINIVINLIPIEILNKNN